MSQSMQPEHLSPCFVKEVVIKTQFFLLAPLSYSFGFDRGRRGRRDRTDAGSPSTARCSRTYAQPQTGLLLLVSDTKTIQKLIVRRRTTLSTTA